jgi:hypothetical protein
MHARTLIFLLTLGVISGRAGEKIELPRLPIAFGEGRTVLSQPEMRGQLHKYLRKGTVVVTESRPQEGQAFGESDTVGEPRTVASSSGYYPVMDLVDERYQLVPYDYIPVLVDWFEALTASVGCTPAETRQAGFRTNKVARLMRVFITGHLRTSGGPGAGVVPAIGWCRALLQEDWGRCRKGETHTFVIVGTDKGWYAVDPYERLIRRIDTSDRQWLLEFVVM